MALSNQDCIALLDESRARLLKRDDLSAGGTVLIRYWPEVSRDDYHALSTFLRTYASALNTSATQFVATPLVDGKPQAGSWFSGKVTWDLGAIDIDNPRSGQKLNLYQILVKGSAGSYITISDTCAEKLEVLLKYEQAAVAAAPSSGNGFTYRVDWSWSQERGTYTVALTRRTVKDQQGAGSAASGRETSATVTHTQSSIQVVAENEAGQIQEAENDPTDACRYRTSLRTRTAIDQAGSATTASGRETAVEASHTQNENQVAVTSADGTIQEAENRPTEFKDRFATRVLTRTAIDQAGAGATQSGRESATLETHTQTATQASVASVAGQIQEAESRPTEFPGRYQTQKSVRTAIDQEAAESAADGRETSATVTHTQGSAQVTATSGAGTIQEAANAPTEFPSRWRTSLRTRTAIDQGSTSTRETGDISESVEQHTQNSAQVTATSGAGLIQIADNDPTEFPSRFRTRLLTRTAKDQEGSRTAADGRETLSEVTHSFNSAQVTAASAAGVIQTAENVPTEFPSRYQTRFSTRTAIDQAGSAFRETGQETLVVATSTQAAAQISANEVDGEIQDAESRPTEFPGRYATVLSRRAAKDQTSSSAVESALESEAIDEHTQNIGQETATPAAGRIVRADSVPTEFPGRYRTRKSTRTAIAYDSAWQSYVDTDGTHYVRIFRNQAAIPALGFTVATQNNLSIQVNEYGLIDGVARMDPESSGGGSSGDAFTTGTGNWSYTNSAGKTVQVNIKYTTSLNAATTFCAAAAPSGYTRRGTDGDGGVVTGIHPMGKGRVCAVRVDVQN